MTTNLSRILSAAKKELLDTDSELEAKLLQAIRWDDLPHPELHLNFDPDTKEHLDFAWPWLMIAVEVQGGTRWNPKRQKKDNRGAHIRTGGYERDRRKINKAQSMGWKVYEFTAAMIESGEALRFLERALKS